MSGFRRNDSTDTDNIFEPASPGMSLTVSGFRGTGGNLTYCPLQFGTQAPATGMRISNGQDLNTQFAAKGSVGYLSSPQTWQNINYAVIDYAQFNSAVALPSPAFITSCSSINGTDHQTAVVRVTFNPDGTWVATSACTNRYNDADTWWNSYGGGFMQTLYNVGQGSFTTQLSSDITHVSSYSGNWLARPAAGAGANYVISASFSPVFDYTATASDISASRGVNYTAGLRGATSGMSIFANGGFVVDAAGNWYSSVVNMSLANAVSICYEWNSSGGFGGALTSFEGPNGALSWLLWTIASVTLATANGARSVSNQLALGAIVNWEQYNSGAGTAWPPTYANTAPHALDASPWTVVNVGAGSQGQFTWSGGSSGGGGVGCVEVGMYLQPDLVAHDVEIGQFIDGIAYQPDRIVPREVTELRFSLQPCWRMVTESDIEIIASDTTPMTLRGGGLKYFPQMWGEEVLVDDYGDVRWESIKTLEFVGLRQVAQIGMRNQNFFAGTDPYRRVGTHNVIAQK